MSIGSSVFAGFVTNRQTFQLVSTRPLPAARQRHVGLPLPQLKFASFNARSLRNKVDAPSDLLTIHGIDITSALFS